MSRPCLVIPALLFALATGLCQEPATPASEPSPQGVSDPTALPFPAGLDAGALQAWVAEAKAQIATRMAASQSAGDRKEVARLLVLLERVRAHAFDELWRLGARTGAGSPAGTPRSPPAPQ